MRAIKCFIVMMMLLSIPQFVCATTVVGTKLTDYLIRDKDEASDTKFYGFNFTTTKDWYGIKMTSSTISYIAGKSTTTYGNWWINRSTYTYYAPADIYSNQLQ